MPVNRLTAAARVLAAAGMCALLWAGAAARADTASGFEGLLLEPPKAVAAQDLVTHNGAAIRFPRTDSGRLQLVFFGYASCPDVCPATLHKVKALKAGLGELANTVDFFLVSIDPARDKPAELKKFVTFFDPAVTGITGDPRAVKALENEFGVLTRKFQGKSAFAYTLEHSVFLYLLDPQGRLLVMYPASAPVAAMASDIRKLSAPKASGAPATGSRG